MKRSVLTGCVMAAWMLPLAACATSKLPKLPVCDGKLKHRRAANPYGSVLPGVPASTPAPGSDDWRPGTLPPPPPPPQTSALAHPSYFASC